MVLSLLRLSMFDTGGESKARTQRTAGCNKQAILAHIEAALMGQ
jgi:hypothetical protein